MVPASSAVGIWFSPVYLFAMGASRRVKYWVALRPMVIKR
ncbi:hypothetical protein CY0110_18007 [Crocosphaera chwakensis CCY0110]|uniref:Uncharacterized protein n=1 Tax=Crocosphaera chwakensis CCY0110 TaxID=391612 RepID=A3IIT3_9CHRO|nr:hypothetical protein CY0110_18007 [Crocosphaera chwakensis CCY0110]